MMSIVDHILNSKTLKGKMSSFDSLSDYFDELPICCQQAWPYTHFPKDVLTHYAQALLFPDRFGFGKVLSVVAECDTPYRHYTVSENMNFDGSLEIELDSVVCEKKSEKQKDNFIYHLIQNHRRFLKSIGDGVLKIQAHSGRVKDIQTSGGYVWALHGFEFADLSELERAKSSFKKYTKENGIEIEDKDLDCFKYPCHFAAFRMKQKINGLDVGKAFLLSHIWNGKIDSSQTDNSECFRYAKSYQEKGKRNAEEELSKSFLKMMRKYNHESSRQNNFFHFLFSKKNGIAR